MRITPEIMEIVAGAHTVAVVGLSSNPARPSFGVARYLQSQGYRILPINPQEKEVLGEKAYPSLEAVPPEIGRIDIVDVFRRSEFVPEIAAAAIRVGARLLWLQEGVAHEAAEAAAREAGLAVVSDLCLLKQHARWRGAMGSKPA